MINIKIVLTRARISRKKAIIFEVEKNMRHNNDGNNTIPFKIKEEIDIVNKVINGIETNEYRVMDRKDGLGEYANGGEKLWMAIRSS